MGGDDRARGAVLTALRLVLYPSFDSKVSSIVVAKQG